MHAHIASVNQHSDRGREDRAASASLPEARPGLLIVDDEEHQVAALCATLRREGYDVIGAIGGEAALEQLRTAKFQLLLTDLQMPGLDGIGLLRAAREHDPDLVGILMTGHGTVDRAVEAMQAGAIDFVTKPFQANRIVAALARALHVQRLQSENAALQQQLAKHVAELEAKNLALEAANKELDAFSHSVSHDLRAPLRAVNGFSEALIEDFAEQMPPEAQRLLRKVAGAATRMRTLVDDLLRFARLDQHALTRRPVDVTTLVHETVAELERDHCQRQVNVRIGELPDAHGDAVLLKQVFTNLLGNAFKFTSQLEQAQVEVGCEQSANGCVYFVRDNGVGFNMQNAGRLFGAFQRLHAATQFEGTGIGLSLVRRIVERHGGAIWAESEPGKGATFRFTIGSAR
jgi:signal transduction histidine kinase